VEPFSTFSGISFLLFADATVAGYRRSIGSTPPPAALDRGNSKGRNVEQMLLEMNTGIRISRVSRVDRAYICTAEEFLDNGHPKPSAVCIIVRGTAPLSVLRRSPYTYLGQHTAYGRQIVNRFEKFAVWRTEVLDGINRRPRNATNTMPRVRYPYGLRKLRGERLPMFILGHRSRAASRAGNLLQRFGQNIPVGKGSIQRTSKFCPIRALIIPLYAVGAGGGESYLRIESWPSARLCGRRLGRRDRERVAL
jgi:hypothetical protein